MARRVTIIGAVLLALVVVAVAVPFVMKMRLKANVVASHNNLRELSLFAAQHAKPDPARDAKKLATEIPAGTVGRYDLPPDERLSWVVPVLPSLNQRKQNPEAILAAIDRAAPWGADANQQAARMRIATLLCPGNTPDVPAGAAAITCYVGVGGLGANAPTLPADSPRAGAFRYDAPTPFARVTDGISQTLLFAESRNDVGPWLRGGRSTVRALDDAPGALPPVGPGGQFGGYFPATANVAMCDGSVRVFTSGVDPRVLHALSTIAGAGTDPVPD